MSDEPKLSGRKRSLANLRPFKRGQQGNPTGKNGASWLHEFRRFFDSPGNNRKTRYENVLQKLYTNALQGSDAAIKTIVEHMKGRAAEAPAETAQDGVSGGVLALPVGPPTSEDWEATMGPLCRAPGPNDPPQVQPPQPGQQEATAHASAPTPGAHTPEAKP